MTSSAGTATPIRVLEAITPSRIAGAETFVADLCKSLAESDTQVTLFCPAGRAFVEFAARRGLASVNWRTVGKADPLTVLRLARLIKARRIDIVHTHLSTASLLGAFAARISGRPVVAHVHSLNTPTCFRYSTALIAVAEAVKRHLTARGMDERKIHVVHNGVDLDKFTPIPVPEAKSRLGHDPEAPLLGIFRRLSAEKGHLTALRAMPTLLRRWPNTCLVLAGEGEELTTLKRSAAALGIADRVRFQGFVPDVRELMSACDVVMLPSLREGLPLAAIEAMALERPVVATPAGGLAEAVADGDTGFIVPANDPEALAQAVGRILEDRPLARQMGKRGRERVAAHFELGKQNRMVLSVLRQVLERQQ